VKVEDNRSLGEKAKNVLSNAGEQYVEALGFVADKTVDLAHQLMDKVTGEAPVMDEEIAEAALKRQELREKEEMDRFRAEGATSSERRDTGGAPVTDEEIAAAALIHHQLSRGSDGPELRKLQLEANVKRIQEEQQLNRQHAEIMRDVKQKQAEEVVRLENKQNEQQAQKCHEAMKKSGACHPHDVTVTKITEIH